MKTRVSDLLLLEAFKKSVKSLTLVKVWGVHLHLWGKFRDSVRIPKNPLKVSLIIPYLENTEC